MVVILTPIVLMVVGIPGLTLTLGFQTPKLRRYDWTLKTYHPNTFSGGIWKTRVMASQPTPM